MTTTSSSRMCRPPKSGPHRKLLQCSLIKLEPSCFQSEHGPFVSGLLLSRQTCNKCKWKARWSPKGRQKTEAASAWSRPVPATTAADGKQSTSHQKAVSFVRGVSGGGSKSTAGRALACSNKHEE